MVTIAPVDVRAGVAVGPHTDLAVVVVAPTVQAAVIHDSADVTGSVITGRRSRHRDGCLSSGQGDICRGVSLCPSGPVSDLATLIVAPAS